MSRKSVDKLLIAFAFIFCFNFAAKADGGAPLSYTPYTMYGIGDLLPQGTAYNRTMAGVGIASHSHRFINPLNPAAVSSRDSLSFMVDFSLSQTNKYFKQNAITSVYNTFNVGDCIMSFPIYRSLAMLVGINSYSGTGYSHLYKDKTPQSVATLGNIERAYTGIGSTYQVFAGLGVSPFKNFTVGAEFIYYFGSIEKVNSVSYGLAACPDITNTNTASINGYTGKFGVQYEFKIGKKARIGLGATYKLSTPMVGDIQYLSVSTKVDTLSASFNNARFADEIGAGISLGISDKLFFEFDYTRSDWTSCGMDDTRFFAIKEVKTPFQASIQQAFRFGMEYVPNRSDVRYYFKRVAYRAGVYYATDYFTVGGTDIVSRGITLGLTLPIFRWYNGVTLGVDFGQRGTLQNNLVKENYFNFVLAVNLFDIWFQKYRYD